jgi:hypothetical protein
MQGGLVTVLLCLSLLATFRPDVMECADDTACTFVGVGLSFSVGREMVRWVVVESPSD